MIIEGKTFNFCTPTNVSCCDVGQMLFSHKRKTRARGGVAMHHGATYLIKRKQHVAESTKSE